MKKALLLIAAVILSVSLHAQNTTNFNRLLLHHNNGSTKGFVIENIDSLTFMTVGNNTIANISMDGVAKSYNIDNIDSLSFASIKGRVAADITITDYTLTSLKLDITRTPACAGFKIACVPARTITYLSDEALAKYIDDYVSDIYHQDFIGAELTGMDFDYDTEYVVLSAAFDKYGVLCEAVKENFITPSEYLVGNPSINVEIIENNLYDFTLRFTPNNDVSEYSVIASVAGSIEYQFNLFASSFGWYDIGDMIEDWGLSFTKQESFQWTELSPHTTYEVYIQARDAEGNRAPYRVFKLKTQALGGEGVAEVAITLGEYTLADWWGEMLPSQFLTFTPNEHTSAYRINVVLAENYNADPEGYLEDLYSEPSMPTDGWYQFETLTTDYQIDPGTKCVAIAVAKNVNGEWGPVTELFFTTPDEMPSKKVNRQK